MARGLSELQKTILRLGLAGREKKENDDPDCFNWQIYTSYYGWISTCDYLGSYPYLPRQLFSRNEIGAKKYNAAHAAYSRCKRSLEKRGLIESGFVYLGVNLTDKGIAVAKTL